MRLSVLIGAMAVAASVLVSAPAPATAALKASSTTCANLVVLGARGSGQGWSSGSIKGFGPEVSGSVKRAVSRIKRKGSVRYVGVDYPAVAVNQSWTRAKYDASVAKGARKTTSTVTSLVRRCPSTRYALVGFSQGASVMRTTIRDLPTKSKDRVVLVGLIGDPERRGASAPKPEVGTLDSLGTGPLLGEGFLGPGAALSSRRALRTVSLCHALDDICNNLVEPGAGPGDLSTYVRSEDRTHGRYYRSAAGVKRTGDGLYGRLSKHARFR